LSLPLIGAADCGADAPRSHWGNKLLPAAVLLVGIVRSGIASQSAREETSRDAQTRLDTVTANAAVQVEGRFAAYFEVLAGLRALFHTVDNVWRQDFHRYAQALSLKRSFPGFQVLNYAPRPRKDGVVMNFIRNSKVGARVSSPMPAKPRKAVVG